MPKILKIETRTGVLTFGDIDAEGEIPINVKTVLECLGGAEISSAHTVWLNSSKLIELGEHIAYLGKKIANARE